MATGWPFFQKFCLITVMLKLEQSVIFFTMARLFVEGEEGGGHCTPF